MTLGDSNTALTLLNNTTLSTGVGDITLGGSVTGAYDFVLNSEGVTTVKSTVNVASLKTDISGSSINPAASGNKVFVQGGSITTSGDMQFAELVLLDKTNINVNQNYDPHFNQWSSGFWWSNSQRQ